MTTLNGEDPADPSAHERPTCRADRDGDCIHPDCPQLRDGEPRATGRHCPLDVDESDFECMVPPLGWRCTRAAGHEGPCAAVAAPNDVGLVERAMHRLRTA